MECIEPGISVPHLWAKSKDGRRLVMSMALDISKLKNVEGELRKTKRQSGRKCF